MSKRAYKPTKLRSLEGGRSNSLPKPDMVNEVKPYPKAPDCSKELSEEAQRAWDKLVPKLERLGLLTEVDGEAFGNLCEIYSRLVAIRTYLNKENASLVQQTERPAPDGGTYYEFKKSPYVTMELQYLQAFRMYAKEFGLTPVGRVGLSVGTDEGEGDDLLSK